MPERRHLAHQHHDGGDRARTGQHGDAQRHNAGVFLGRAFFGVAVASCVGERLASSMSSPISSRIRPPAISNAGRVIPNIRKMSWPASAKLVSTMKQVSAALRAMRLRRSASRSAVMARNDGMAAKGSTRKKMELSASTEKRTMGA